MYTRSLCLILGFFVFAANAFADGAGVRDNVGQVRKESLKRLNDLRNENVKRLTEIDHTLHQKLEANLGRNLIEDVEKIQHDRHEYVLRQALLDRLILEIDGRYTSGNFRDFFEHALIEEAQIEATNESRDGTGELWKFMKYAAECVHRLPEQREDVIAFIEGYMKRSVANPIPPEEYLASRNYSNGAKSETANPMDREKVGAFVDQRLKQMKAAKTPAPIAPKPEPVQATTPAAAQPALPEAEQKATSP